MASHPSTDRVRGVFTALVTPYSEDARKLDLAAFEAHCARQVDGGVAGLVACGTTGETPTLLASEMQELIATAKRVAGGRVPVVAGTCNNDTWDTIELCKGAVKAGADMLMIVSPYYNKPSQQGLIRHIELIAEAVDVPIMLYNIPGRTAVTMSVETTLRILEKVPNVVAVKDATGGLSYCQELIARIGDRASVMCGDDGLVVPMMSVGVRGVVSVTSNLLPREVVRVVDAAEKGDFATARREHLRLLDVHGAMFVEPNPQPVKTACAARGWMNDSLRPPMVPASPETRAHVLAAVAALESR
ncbi:MAG TPA: 4-hydroxy-tetrahydrodipicolinate synthase [Polyangiaceae bacterium]|nr:4-hydroxy-tetrahydrodipicolinate synthase [Polyangiaceae bacterium]